MNVFYQPPEEFETLLTAMADEMLTDSQERRLAELLRGDPAARTYYLDYVAMLSTLSWDYAPATHKEAVLSLRCAPLPRRRHRWQRWSWTSAAAAVLAIAAIWMFNAGRQPFPRPRHERSAVAALTDVSDAVWASEHHPSEVGEGLPPGRIALQSGVVQIEFDSGARVRLEGPVELELISSDRATLHRGKLSAWVPAEARGFTVDAPGVTVVDLGTAFALSSDGRQFCEAHTFEGQVVAMVPATSQQPATSLSLTGNTTKRVEIASGRVVDVPFDARRFLDPPDHGRHLPRVSGRLRFLRKPLASVEADGGDTYQYMLLFREREEVPLPRDVQVSCCAADEEARSASGVSTIPRGTHVQTYLLHFNRQRSPDFPDQRRNGWVTFAEPILGLIFNDDRLDATDANLGNPAVLYPHNTSRSFRPRPAGSQPTSDVVTVMGDRKTLFVDFALVRGLRQVRVLLAPGKGPPDRRSRRR